MISRSTLLHLRIPFSFFLLPVYLFALSISNTPAWQNVLFVFFIVHFLLYPASNGYNSYFDKDKKSIGGLRHPPAVTKELYSVSLILDIAAIVFGLMINIWFGLMLFIYGMISKAYSHPSVRIKKYPVLSWLTAGFFQGFFTFMMCYLAMNDAELEIFRQQEIMIPAFLSSVMLWGSYPMTQIYQHEEDAGRGDITLSLKLGIPGTFYFTGGFFMLATVAFMLFYLTFFESADAYTFLIFTIPMVLYFFRWYLLVRKDRSKANFGNSMGLNLISSVCLSLFFIWMTIKYTFL